MGADYYGIVTDSSRLWDNEISPTSSTITKNFFAQFVNFGLSVIIFLIFFALVVPIIAVCLDRKDYADLRREKYEVSEHFMKKVAIRR
jgi:flagellar biosynthesis/type III secretory pathway M-ring protein FliF/YscJ